MKTIPSQFVRLTLLFAAVGIASCATPHPDLLPEGEGKPNISLQIIVDKAVGATLAKFQSNKLATNEIAVTLIDLANSEAPKSANYRGNEPIYPASVVKLFYLVATHRWLEDGRIQDTPELRRAMKDMIVDSYNEATHYIVDVLTDTTSGPELSQPELDQWFEKRNAVNRYFESLGYNGINANRKPWCEGPYGRESQSIRVHDRKRNMLTTDATARLLSEIVSGKAVSKDRCDQMLKLLERNPFQKSSDPDDQATGFSGPSIPPGSKLWSKSGWTSATRHDATCIQLPDGHKIILVTFTTNHANEREIIPFLVAQIIQSL